MGFKSSASTFFEAGGRFFSPDPALEAPERDLQQIRGGLQI
jgi:hypothetical protein